MPRWLRKDTFSNVSSMPVKEPQIQLKISDIEPFSRVFDRFGVVRRELEDCLKINSVDAKIKEEISRVFIKIDEMREFRDSTGKSVLPILDKIGESHEIIGSILKSHKNDLSSDDFSRLSSCLEHLSSNLDWAREVISGFQALGGKLIWLISILEHGTIKKGDWQKIISGLTVVTKRIDVFNAYLDDDHCDLILQGLEMISKAIISYSLSNQSRLSGFGFADISSYSQPDTAELLARQMLVVVETKRKVWLEGQNAEAKALTRMMDEDVSAWEVVRRPGDSINIDDIKSRLKKRVERN